MKVLIISLPRTGSTSLMKSISDEKKLKYYEEPYGIDKSAKIDFDVWEQQENIVVKSLIGQPRIKDRVSFYEKLSKHFDEVILLSRRDLQSVAESYAYLSWYNKTGFSYEDKYVWKKTPNLKDTFQLISNLNDDIIKLSNKLNIKISYYEDLFDLNSKNRLRQNEIKKDII